MKKAKKSLTSFSILVIIIFALAALSWIVSASSETVIPATLADITMSIANGFYDAQDVCFFVMILGGFLAIVTKTGALDAGIATLVRKLNGKEEILIAVIMFIFSIGGTTYGMCEETVPFYLLLASTMVAAGFDTMVGAATVLLGAGVGVLGSTVNPFATGAAASACVASGLDVNNGVYIAIGVILWLTSYAIALFFVLKYAKKVKADKGSTILSLQEQEDMKAEFIDKKNTNSNISLTKTQSAVLWIFAITFVIMVMSFVPWEDFGINIFVGWSSVLTGVPLGQWWFGEATTWFLLASVVIAIVGKISERDYVSTLYQGIGDMMPVVIVIAVARGASVIMSTTGLDAWILDAAANLLAGVPAIIFTPLAYIVYMILSFFIPSSSGLASVSMPIMGPLAARLGFSVEAMIMIFCGGNGLICLFTPTMGAIMGGLSIAKVEWSTWMKWSIKPIVCIGIMNIIVLTAAMLIL